MAIHPYPGGVKVGAHVYAVQYESLIYDTDEQQEYLGRANYPDCQMQIKTGRAPSQMAETFLHEVVHAISNDRRLEMSEHQVDQVAAGLLALIVDNPDVFGKDFVKKWEAK